MQNELFLQFHELNIAKDTLGLECNKDMNVTYFCTPIGAEIIGWPGVDGIHFCFIPSVNADMVFVVSPMPGAEHHVEPVARTFNEFLAMVLYCKGASPIEQISWMTEEQYIDLIKEEYSYNWEEREEALNTLREELGIVALNDVYNTVKKIQAEFNYEVIPFSEEYRLSR